MLRIALPSIRLPHVKMNAVIEAETIAPRAKPWGKYVEEGLIFQLDCQTGVNLDNSAWKDVIEKYVASVTGMFVTSDGGVTGTVNDSTKTFADVYVEKAYKTTASDELQLTSDLYASTTLSFGGSSVTTYAFRVYEAAQYSNAVKTANQLVDSSRFDIPAGSLYDVDDFVVTDSDGDYIIMSD